MEKISHHCLKVKALGQTTEGKEFRRQDGTSAPSPIRWGYRKHSIGSCPQIHVQMPPSQDVFWGWLEQCSLCWRCGVEGFLVSKFNQNNRGQFIINMHLCVHALSTTYCMPSNLSYFEKLIFEMVSFEVKEWNVFVVQMGEVRSFFKGTQCPVLSYPRALNSTELFIQQSDICFPNRRNRNPKDEKLSLGMQSTGKANSNMHNAKKQVKFSDGWTSNNF